MKPERDEIFYASVRKLFHVSQNCTFGQIFEDCDASRFVDF